MTKKVIYLLCLLAGIGCSGNHNISKSEFDGRMGGDIDEHGCKGSAGYTWSYVLHDCVRLWEAGLRCESGQKSVFVVFNADSTQAEVFATDSEQAICHRQKADGSLWKAKSGEEVSLRNGVLTVKTQRGTFTHTLHP